MIDEDWHGFSTAFAEAARPAAGQRRAGGRMLVTALATVLAVAVGALVYGAFGGGSKSASPDALVPITPSPQVTGLPGQSAGAQPGATWTAVAGPTCATGSGRFAVYGYYTGLNSDQTTGWTTSANGGYTGASCTGGFLSMPVSGRASAYDGDRFALWSFDFSSEFTSASCQVQTYIPHGFGRSYVGGNPAYYYYYETDYTYGSTDAPLGGFRVSQVSQRGRWVTGGSFKVTTGTVVVKMVDAGARTGPQGANAHDAVSQVRLTCDST